MTNYDGSNRLEAPLPQYQGKHVWVVVGTWQIMDPTAEIMHFDHENLIQVIGPGCLYCGLVYDSDANSICLGNGLDAGTAGD